MSYTVNYDTPSTDTFIHLRSVCGLGTKTVAASQIGLANSLFSVQVIAQPHHTTCNSTIKRNDGERQVVGMGRIIGDGGTAFIVVDVCVLPAHQGKGLGKMIMSEIKKWLDANVPESGYVSLLADGEAKHLYAQFGFKPYEIGIGMAIEY